MGNLSKSLFEWQTPLRLRKDTTRGHRRPHLRPILLQFILNARGQTTTELLVFEFAFVSTWNRRQNYHRKSKLSALQKFTRAANQEPVKLPQTHLGEWNWTFQAQPLPVYRGSEACTLSHARPSHCCNSRWSDSCVSTPWSTTFF